MILRRDLLKWAASGLGVGLTPAAADTAPATTIAPATTEGTAPQGSTPPVPAFDFNMVVETARKMARKAREAVSASLPAPFGNLAYDQYVSIRPKTGTAVWAGDNVGFAVEPLHRGFLFTAPMVINVVENGAIRRLGYPARPCRRTAAAGIR